MYYILLEQTGKQTQKALFWAPFVMNTGAGTVPALTGVGTGS